MCGCFTLTLGVPSGSLSKMSSRLWRNFCRSLDKLWNIGLQISSLKVLKVSRDSFLQYFFSCLGMTLIQTAMFLTGCWINQSKLTTELNQREKCIQSLSRKKMQPVRSAWNYYALLITCVIKPSKSNHGWWIVYKTLSLFWGCMTWAILFNSL